MRIRDVSSNVCSADLDPAQRARLAELARDLVASIDDRSIGDAVGAIEDSLLRRGRCPPAGRLVDDVTGSGAITQASRLGRNQPLYARVLALGGGVGLQFAQTLVTAGANHRDAMLFLSRQRDPFKVAALPGISADEQTEQIGRASCREECCSKG